MQAKKIGVLVLLVGLLSLLLTACSSEPAFKEYNSSEYKFSVQIPGTPAVKTLDVPQGYEKGSTITSNGDAFAYAITLFSAPVGSDTLSAANIDGLLQDFATGVANKSAKIVKQQGITIGTAKGMEITSQTTNGGYAKTRIVVSGNTLYTFSIIAQDLGKLDGKEAKTYFDSIKLT